uniref:BHLH domain-containing protein n=2 Tax=Schistosoma mansoni TaxID=6183 RepID=A0A5K4F0T5_SCHMA
MTSSSVICKSFNSDIPYSELTPIDLNTTPPTTTSTNTITSSSNIIDPITTTITTTSTTTNDLESSIIHENANLPIRCKSLEIKSTEKSSISKKRHRSTVDNQWNRSNSMNTLLNLKYHHTKTNLCLPLNDEQKHQEECMIDVKKRKTMDDNMLQVDTMIPESSVYNYTTNKAYEYEESIHDYPKFKSFNQQLNMSRTYSSHWMNSYEQLDSNKEELTNELTTNRIPLKQSMKKGSTRDSITKTLTNYDNNNHGNWNTFNDTMNVNHHQDEMDNELSSASELTTAAYNNFVRRVVDDTLDRTVTFCEQPRHAITALENICTRAWPQLEVKRHRTRIRAYLKACRRNSKKNKGQINMKEPPANGLSIEARQLVSKALTLVAGDLDYLRQVSKGQQITEKVKNESLFSSSKLDNSSEKSYSTTSTTSKRSPASYTSKMNLSTITTTTTSAAAATGNSLDYTEISKQRHDPFETYGGGNKLKFNNNNNDNNNNHGNKNLWNISNNLLNDIINNTSFPFTDPLFWSNSFIQNTNLDGNYLATAAAAAAAATAMAAVNPANLLKLLPASIQLNNNTYPSTNIITTTTGTTTTTSTTSYSLTTSPFTSSSSSSVFSNSPRLLNNDNVNNSENIILTTTNTTNNNNNSNMDCDVKHDQLTIQGKYSKRNKLLSNTTWFDDDHLLQTSTNNGIHGNSLSPKLNESKFTLSDKDFNIESEISRQSNLMNLYRLYFSNDPSHNNNHYNNDLTYCSPPPAHISSIQYSPIINQILDRLTDSSLLTHDDVEFFIKNFEITKVAIQQARCRSNLILKKIEIVENQLKSSSMIHSKTMPLNLS